MDKTKTIFEMLVEKLAGKSDNVLKKACIAYLNEDEETLKGLLEELKLTDRVNSFLTFVNRVMEETKPEYAYEDKFFPLDNIQFSVDDFDKNFNHIPTPHRSQVAVIIKKHGGDSPLIRMFSGDPNIEINEDFVNFLDTQAYTTNNPIFQQVMQLLQAHMGLDKCAEFAKLHGYQLVKYAEPKKEEPVEDYIELRDVLGNVLGKEVVHNFFDKSGKFKVDAYEALPKPEKTLIESYLKKIKNEKSPRPTH